MENVAADHPTDFFSNLDMLFDLDTDLVLSDTLVDATSETPPPPAHETGEVGTSSTDSNQLESNGGGLANLFEEAFDFPNWTTPESGLLVDALPVPDAPEVEMDFSMVGLSENDQAAKWTNLGFGLSTAALTLENASGYAVKPAVTPPLPLQLVDAPNVMHQIKSSLTSTFLPATAPMRAQHSNHLVGLIESGSSSSMQPEQGTGVCGPEIQSCLLSNHAQRYDQTIANCGIHDNTQQPSSIPISYQQNTNYHVGRGLGFSNRGKVFMNSRWPDRVQFRPRVQYCPPLSNFRYSWTSQPVQNIWQTQRVNSSKLAEKRSNNIHLNYGILSERQESTIHHCQPLESSMRFTSQIQTSTSEKSDMWSATSTFMPEDISSGQTQLVHQDTTKYNSWSTRDMSPDRPAENQPPEGALAPEVYAQYGNFSNSVGSCLIQWLQGITQRLATSCAAERQVFEGLSQNWNDLERIFREEFEVLLNKMRKESEDPLQPQLLQPGGNPTERIAARGNSSSSSKRQKKEESTKSSTSSEAEDLAKVIHGISAPPNSPPLRTVQSSIYNPEFQELGQPVDPHLRLFHVN